ncbi:MAG: hypothetical protein IIA60_14830 [Candidatus Marinimicrobia bacterium]|nr:hypothetical protein [Candidatus Neomarinimicrobiota bacterium]
MKKKITIMLLVSSLFLVGCYTQTFVVGNGPQTGQTASQRQWFALWGLIALTQVDTGALAGGASDYEIQTQLSGLDVIIGMVAGSVTVSSRTVTVTK